MAAFVESGGLDQVLDQLVEGAAFDQFATELGFGVSKRLIDGRIADLPAFAGVSGKFDQTVFENFLRQNGISEAQLRSEEHTSELQSLMRISYAVFFLKKKKNK